MPEWLYKLWQKNYNSKFGDSLRRAVYGRDYNLSDEEYLNKYGFMRPSTSAGILDLMSPTSAGKLLKVGNELKEAERAARVAKQARSLKDSQTAERIMSTADELKIGKSGRTHIVRNANNSPIATSNVGNITNVTSQQAEQAAAFKNAMESYQNALEMGNYRMAQEFYKDAQSFKPVDIFRKQGGIISVKSGIHIKKENRGKFTSYCGGKVTSECIARGKHSSNPAIRKRATFAANARKWKHQYGGKIIANWVYNTLSNEN